MAQKVMINGTYYDLKPTGDLLNWLEANGTRQ